MEQSKHFFSSDDRVEDSSHMHTEASVEKQSNHVNSPQKDSILSSTEKNNIESDDYLSDLDENQFRDFDESQLEKEQEYTIASLPSFRKKQSSYTEKKEISQKGRTKKSSNDNYSIALKKEKVDDRPIDPILAAKWDLDQQMNKALVSQKRRIKVNEVDLEKFADDEIVRLKEQMRQAANADANSKLIGEPASQKIALLPVLISTLRKKTLFDAILDNNLLESMRMWLEPLPDKSLPALDIQRAIFDALQTLPIQTDHLRESGIGKVILFYRKSRKPEHAIKRVAEKLIVEWTRPIIKRSANFRDRTIKTMRYDSSKPRPIRINSEYDRTGRNSTRARIPRSDLGTYLIAPQQFFINNNSVKNSLHGVDKMLKLKNNQLAASIYRRKNI